MNERAKELAVEHLTKAFQIGGRQGTTIVETYARMAGAGTYLQRLLYKALEIAKKEHYLTDSYERNATAGKVEQRKWVAQVRSQDKYDSERFGSLPRDYPSDFRKSSIESPEFWRPLALRLVADASAEVGC